MKRLQIRQLQFEGLDFFNCFEFQLIDMTDNVIILKDSIDDVGQGIEEATKQIHQILRRRGYIQ